MLIKLGTHLRILKTANVAEDVLLERPVEAAKPVISKVIEAKNSDFLYYRARAISAGDQGPMGKDGSRGWNFNGNKDYFPRKELESSYETFVGRNIFLDHNSESSLYSIGKIIDALPIDDKETGEFYIELVGKIDRTLHPEICRKIETGELNSTSMGCSVDESICSVCGHVLHSDADEKCNHMGMNLGKEFPAEFDAPEYNIKKGDMIPCFSINKGIVFNEDSIVGVPADPTAVIKTVLSNMKSQISKKASLTKQEQLDLAAQMDKLFDKLDDSTKIQLKADFCGICPPVEKESSMTDKSVVPNDETKKILNKISAYEMEQLESYVIGKTKKANEIASLEIVADSAAKEESFLSKIVAKVKESLSKEAKKCGDCGKKTMMDSDEVCDECEAKYEKYDSSKKSSVTALASEKESLSKEAAKCERCEDILSEKDPSREYDPDCAGHLCAKHEEEFLNKKKSSISAKFQEDKNNVLDSTWSVNDGNTTVLEASLKEIWGSKFELLSFDDQRWATSPEYAKEIVARYTNDGIIKLADAWDVSHKLSKVSATPIIELHVSFKSNTIEASEHIENQLWSLGRQNVSDSGVDRDGSGFVNFHIVGSETLQKLIDKINVFNIPNLKMETNSLLQSSLKTAAEPKMGPSGTRVKPSTGSSNKEHSYPTNPKFEKPGQETAQKGPAAPAPKEVKTVTKIDMPGQEKGQTGPAAPKPKEVKTDYNEPKPEAEGKEVKTTPKNPEQKKHEKSEKEVKTDYVAAGTEAMETEDGKEKKEASINYKQANAAIKWSSLSPEAQDFIKKHVEKHIKEDGMERAQAVAAAYSEAREKGMDVPSKKSAQETDMKKQASDGKPDESVEGSTLPEGTKSMGDKVEESVQGTTVPGGAKPSAAPETSAQGDKEHKTPNLTKKPDEAVDGTTLPPQGKKDEESVEKSTHPDGKKSVGTEPEKSVQASKSESSAPVEAVQDKPALSKETAGDTPESARKGGDLKKDPKDIESVNKKAATEIESVKYSPKYSVFEEDGEWYVLDEDNGNRWWKFKTKEEAMAARNKKEKSVKHAATEQPMPEDKDPMESMKPEAPLDEKPMDLPLDGPEVGAPEEASAFDTAETVDIGEGYSAMKDKATNEIIVSKDGAEVKRLPDGFGKDMAIVLSLMKAVLGLPPEAVAPEVPGAIAPVEKGAPQVEEHPAVEEAHEDELGMKESALKVKEAALEEKEAAINAKEAAIKATELSKKFASVIQARTERARKIIAVMVEKDALQMNKEVYESELKSGTYLLDAQKKAFEFAILAKQKELVAMDDNALLATEKVIADLKAPTSTVNTKRASRIYVSPSFGEELSEDAQLKKIFDTFGNSSLRPK